MRQMRNIIRPYSWKIKKNRVEYKKGAGNSAFFNRKAENGTRTHDPFITSDMFIAVKALFYAGLRRKKVI